MSSTSPILKEILRFSAPKYSEGVEPCIYFYAFDPKSQTMRRKKIKIKHIGNKSERRKRAPIICQKLMELLSSGWSPWEDHGSPMFSFDDALEHYIDHITREHKKKILKDATFATYCSYIKMLRAFNSEMKKPIKDISQLTETYLSRFLDWILNVRKNTARTYNNYINFFNTLCNYFIRQEMLQKNPAEKLNKIKRSQTTKKKNNLSDKDIQILFSRLRKHDKKFLLACYFEYYCFIRPNELYQIKIKNINVDQQTIFIPANISKNSMDGYVTIPDVIMELLNELNVLIHPQEHYIFGENFATSSQKGHRKMFGNYWDRHIINGICPELKGKGYCFYALKGTGITAMLKDGIPTITVRDQARHQDITTTEIYTRGGNLVIPALPKDYKK